MTKYLSLLYLVACITCANAQVADKITVIGNDQTSNPSPSSFSQEVRFHVKWNSSIGVPHIGSPGPGTYSPLMTIAPWSDGTGSKHHQLNFNEDGLFWRKGAFGSSWEPWKRIVTANENGNVGIGLTNPSFALSINAVENQTVLGGNTKSAIRIMNGYAEAFGRRSEIQFGLGQSTNETLAVIAAEYSAWGNDVGGDLIFGTSPNNSTAVLERMRINYDGNIGIGTITPQAKLHVHDETALPQATGSYHLLERISGRGHNYFMKNTWMLRDAGTTTQWWTTRLHDGISIDGSYLTPGVDTRTWWERDPMDNIQSWGDSNQTYMTLKNGALGIGTTDPDSKLTVKGDIHTREVKVDLNGAVGPDYVFEKDYDLLSLTELETYITQHKHLPEVPSAKEMDANGLNLKEMNLLLLKKVEELTLHLIEQQKHILKLDIENQELKNRMTKIESQTK